MTQRPTELPTGARARWLAELAHALDDAHRLLSCLEVDMVADPELMQLFVRIEAARIEVDALRLSRASLAGQKAPNWIELMPWQPRSVREA